jgi:hypothetical protein
VLGEDGLQQSATTDQPGVLAEALDAPPPRAAQPRGLAALHSDLPGGARGVGSRPPLFV